MRTTETMDLLACSINQDRKKLRTRQGRPGAPSDCRAGLAPVKEEKAGGKVVDSECSIRNSSRLMKNSQTEVAHERSFVFARNRAASIFLFSPCRIQRIAAKAMSQVYSLWLEIWEKDSHGYHLLYLADLLLPKGSGATPPWIPWAFTPKRKCRQQLE
jgi:hypothetical protein